MNTRLASPSSDSSSDHKPQDAARQRDPVEQAAEEFLDAYRSGVRSPISEWTQRYPDQADEIRNLFPALIAIERLGARTTDDLRQHVHPEQLGLYRIVGEVGRGGMGVVYEARHTQLGRRVALKVLPAELANDESALRRFQREARAVANLQHANIVPVYEVGQDGETHYYAMQFIDGQSLDQLIEHAEEEQAARVVAGHVQRRASLIEAVSPHFPLSGSGNGTATRRWSRFVASIGCRAAAALDYAHSQGVLHRDIKPSNLMLDQSGTVWVVDFGLAQIDDVQLTRSSSLAGTLRFMPPERFRGWCDPRSDVYSLGLSLYELLTQRMAFSAAEQAELIRKINDTVPVRPSSLLPDVPVDLETILGTAIAREPEHRYQSAADMAADLKNFLENRPITARRPTVPGRFVRWCRRRPQVAALSLVLSSVLLIATVVAIIAAAGFRQQSRQLSRQAALLEKQTEQLTVANGLANRKLFESLINEAQARRWSQRAGQRFGTLDSVEAAVQLFQSSGLDADVLRLRNEAIAAMAHGDIRFVRSVEVDGLLSNWTLSPDFTRIAFDVRDEAGGWQMAVARLRDQRRLWTSANRSRTRIMPRFSPDGRLLAVTSASSGLTEVRHAASGDVLLVALSAGNDPVAFDRSCRHMAVPQSDGDVLLYQLETLPQLAPPERIETGFSEPVSVRMHPTEPMLVVWGVSQQDVVLLHLETGQQQRLPINARRPVDIAVSPDGRLVAAGSADFNAYVWHSGHQTVLHQLTGHQSQVVGVFFSSDSHLVATRSWDQTTRLWNPDSGRFLLAIDGETQFGQDAGQLAIRNQNQVTICDLADGREFQVMRGHEGGKGPWTLDVSPDGNLLASAGADGVRIWDTVTAQQVAHLSVGPGQIALFHPDGSGVFTGGSRKLEFWPLETLTNGSGRGDISLGIGKSRHVARTVVVPDRFCADITRDGTLVWFADYDRVRTSSPPFVAHTDITCRSDSSFLAISPDGRLAATSHESDSPFVSVRDTASGEELHRFPHQRGHIRPRFSPDSRHLVTNVPSEYYVWDVVTGECLTTIPRSSGLHGAIAWTADGRTLALECGGVHLLNGETFEPLAVLGPPVSHGIATALEITPDGRRLFAAYESREIHCWDLQRIRDQLGDLGLDWE